jgi:hypothetical protein
LLAPSAFTQEVQVQITPAPEPTPTREECQIDMHLFSEMYGHRSQQDLIPFKNLKAYEVEMGSCAMTVDAANESLYYTALLRIVSMEHWREQSFLMRHDLYKKFLAEDAAGVR